MRIFSLQFCEFSVIFLFNLWKILDLERNNMNTHFCFSERLILREKRFADFLLGHWSTKKITNFQKILKKHHTGELHKKVQFCTRRRKHTFFYSPCTFVYIYKIALEPSAAQVTKIYPHLNDFTGKLNFRY